MKSLRAHRRTGSLLVSVLLLGSGMACDRGASLSSPTAPIPPGPRGAAEVSSWTATVAILALSGEGNCAGAVLRPRENVPLTIALVGDSIRILGMVEGQAWDLEYEGALSTTHFVAATGDDGSLGCFLWRGDLTGDFTADFRNFEALERIEYRNPDDSLQIVERRWTAARL